jgi:hypothetical protein
MKAISLWQPWASFMAIDLKRNETRGRRCHIRGDIVVCAAKSWRLPSQRVCELMWDKMGFGFNDFEYLVRSLPYGKAICAVECYDCVPTEDFHLIGAPVKISQLEADLGNYTCGRFAWLTRNLRPFKEPFPVRGRQGWFDIPDEIVAKALLLESRSM